MPSIKTAAEVAAAAGLAPIADQSGLKPISATTRPYRVVDRRAAHGFVGGNNQLYQASNPPATRAQIHGINDDTHRSISPAGRGVIMTYGRWLFANFPSIEGAIQEQAAIAVSSWFPRFQGSNKRWGRRAEEWLIDWEDIMNVSGSWIDGDLFRELLIYCVLVDGEMGVMLTQTESGFPQIQIWMSHQIGENFSSLLDSSFDRSAVIDGVIVNSFRRPRKYLLQSAGSIRPVPASDFILAYCPTRPDQVRGISKLGSSVFDWQDLSESRRFELVAQKACAAHALIEHNEGGETDPTKSLIQSDGQHNETTGNLESPPIQNLEGGIYRYLAAKTGSKLEAFRYDRPGANVQQFQRDVEMHAFRGLEWDRGFTLDSSKINGTSIRVVVDRINRTVGRRQKLVKKVMRRIHAYAIAKAIQIGELPFDKDWFRWGYQVPAVITPDRKHQSDVDLQEYEQAIITMEEMCARRGTRWEETQDQWLRERKRMQEKAEKLGVSMPQSTPQPVQEIKEDDVRRIVDENQSSPDSGE